MAFATSLFTHFNDWIVSSMLFGDKDTFAIEAEMLEIYDKWTYGRLRFWIGGRPVGDFEDTSDLAGSARWGRTFLAASPRRTRPDLDQTSCEGVYATLHGRFVQPSSAAADKGWPGPWEREPFLLDEVGESALRDKFSIIAVRRGDGSERIVVSSFDDECVWEVAVAPGACDRTIESYCRWVEQLRS
jgi:hypothetical protein